MDTTDNAEEEWKRNMSELFPDNESDDQSQSSKKLCVENNNDELYRETMCFLFESQPNEGVFVTNELHSSEYVKHALADTRILQGNGSKLSEHTSVDEHSSDHELSSAFNINDVEDTNGNCQVITDDEFDSDSDSDDGNAEYSFSDNVGNERTPGRGNFFENVRTRLNTCSHCDFYCEAVSNKSKSSDSDMADKAMKMNMEDFFKIQHCQRDCKNDKKCTKDISLFSVFELRKRFWGKKPGNVERRSLIQKELKKANDEFVRRLYSGDIAVRKGSEVYPFTFLVGDKEVCEKAFINLLGIANFEGYKTPVWTEEVDIFQGFKMPKTSKKKSQEPKDKSSGSKFEHAYSYILDFVNSEINDRSAYENNDNSVYLPYQRLSFFYGEYDWYCNEKHILHRARETTFRSAWKQVKKDKKSNEGVKLKFNEGKGSFDKCEICHNAEVLLSRSKWSLAEEEVIKAYRRRHIEQQFAERVTLQSNIASTYQLDPNGQPTKWLVFMDGFTVQKGNTPKRGPRHSKGDNSFITSRIIGVEVHCGPIHGTLLYYTDNLVSGGANVIIEVMRQSLLDLQELLKNRSDKHGNPLDLPREGIFQFDNCKENKNKYVFTYISLLVQEGLFSKIEVFFLIVGHTHASIDQFFSILSKRISRHYFIGSPLALECLLCKVEMGEKLSGKSWLNAKSQEVPLLVRKISVVYDMKNALTPLINKKIKYYIIPHKFVFEMFHCVCTMQYSIFSTHRQLLPIRPERINDIQSSDSLDVALRVFNLVGGAQSFSEACGTQEIVTVFSEKSQKALGVHNVLRDMYEELVSLEATIVKDMVRLDLSSDFLKGTQASKEAVRLLDDNLIKEISEQLKNANTAEAGLIMWLNTGVSRDIKPEPLHLKETLQFLNDNKNYSSVGCDVCDLYNRTIDEKYDYIKLLLEKNSMWPEEELKTFDVEPTRQKMIDLCYLKPTLDKCSNEQLENSMKDIVATSNKVFKDISVHRLKVSGDNEFDFSAQFNISKSELVFYYYRMTNRGIYLELLKAFEDELKQPYSILPLLRPTNKLKAIELASKGSLYIASMERIAGSQLQRPEDRIQAGQEVLTRQGLNKITTVSDVPIDIEDTDDASHINVVLSSLSSSNSINRQKTGDANEKRLLKLKTIKDLKTIGLTEGLKLTQKVLKNKETLVEAICARRSALLLAPVHEETNARKVVNGVADTQNKFETNDVNDATRDVDVTDNENLLA